MASPDNFEILAVVFHADSNVISGLQTRSPKYIAEANCCLMKFEKRGDFSRLGLNDRWSLRVGSCCDSWVHVSKLID